MEPSELNERQRSLLGYLKANQGMPLNAERAARATSMTASTVHRTIERLIAMRVVASRKKEGKRYVDVLQPEPEPMRVMRDACPRCQTVNCTRHTASRLTNSRVFPGAPMRMW